MVGVPTARGMGSAFKDFGVGLLGGLIFIMALRLFGGLGVLAAPLIAGSMVKGDRGQIIATLAGFALVTMGGLTAGGGGGPDQGEM
ncbi:MAG TPA: hypothetical protein G4O01_02910 [Dehalococcoidia bacterium]|nr:hypothetical protein [Dehalococcoidia bacterium]